MDTDNKLGVWDYVVFAASLLSSVAIGLYYHFSGGRNQTNRAYLLGDKNLSIWPVSMSLMASFMSAITLLGVPAENYMFSTQFLAINISYIIGTPICAYVFLPVFFQLQNTSAYEVSTSECFHHEETLLLHSSSPSLFFFTLSVFNPASFTSCVYHQVCLCVGWIRD